MGRTCFVMWSVLLAGGCATVPPPDPASPLLVRQAQTRIIETAESRLVVKAAISALQDEGFVIREANAELGLVTAVKEWKSRQRNEALRVLKWVAALPTYGATLLVPSGRTEFTVVEASVNVTQEASGARARISLVSRVIDKQGRLQSVTPVDDPLAYQALLARLDKAVFLQREGL